MDPAPSVLNQFAEACERSLDMLPLKEDEGLALIFRDICRDEWQRLDADKYSLGFGLPSHTDQYKAEQQAGWLAEANTWDLIHRLYLERLTGANDLIPDDTPGDSSGGQRMDVEVQAHTAVTTDHALVQRLFAQDRQLVENNIVRDWLEAIAPPFHATLARPGYWLYTRNYLKNKQASSASRSGQSANSLDALGNTSAYTNSGRGHPLSTLWANDASGTVAGSKPSSLAPEVDAYTTTLDPDAPLREVKSLHPEDASFEHELVRTLFQYIRRGRLVEAMELCIKCGMAWRAASIRGGLFFQDSRLDGDDHSDVDDNDNFADGEENHTISLGGTLNRALWKETCVRLAQDPSLDVVERAMYAALSGTLTHILPVCETWEDYVWAHYTAMIEHKVEAFLSMHSRQQALVYGTLENDDDEEYLADRNQRSSERQSSVHDKDDDPFTWDLKDFIDVTQLPGYRPTIGASALPPLEPDAVFDHIAHSEKHSVAVQASQDPYRRIQRMVILGRSVELAESFAEQFQQPAPDQVEAQLASFGEAGWRAPVPMGMPRQQFYALNPDLMAYLSVTPPAAANPEDDNATEPTLPIPVELVRLMAHLVIYLRTHGIELPELAADTIVYHYIRYLVQQAHQKEAVHLKHQADGFSGGAATVTVRNAVMDSLLSDSFDPAQWIALYTAKLPRQWQIPVYAQYLTGIQGTGRAREHALQRGAKAGLNIRRSAQLATDVILKDYFAHDYRPLNPLQVTLSGLHTALAPRERWAIRALEFLSHDRALYRGLLLRCNILARRFLAEGKIHALAQLLDYIPKDLILPGWIEAVKRLQDGRPLGLGIFESDDTEDPEAEFSNDGEGAFDWQLGWDSDDGDEDATKDNDGGVDASIPGDSMFAPDATESFESYRVQEEFSMNLEDQSALLESTIDEFTTRAATRSGSAGDDPFISASSRAGRRARRSRVTSFSLALSMDHSTASHQGASAPSEMSMDVVGSSPIGESERFTTTVDPPQLAHPTREQCKKQELLAAVQEYFHYRNLLDCFTAYDAWSDCLAHKPVGGTASAAMPIVDWSAQFKSLSLKAEESLRRLLESDWLSYDIHAASDESHPDTTSFGDPARNAELETLRNWVIPEIVFRLHTVLLESHSVIPSNLDKSIQLSDLVADEQFQLYREFMKTNQLPKLLHLFAQSSMVLLKKSTNPFVSS
ncbi:Nucleoporin nup84 [Dimargaris xerosporica]|nr:Nucleoporin nup84 [Dimargaris xerosporica]